MWGLSLKIQQSILESDTINEAMHFLDFDLEKPPYFY